ncbi:MAG: 23S rRNA (pseudouridine(1915)-N(3))-methyltransferase RlmH [Clostridia bacterium]|nr:23S rRNA (pseudouridine(1915)-N(3))-methyltransferase RlmH [Clostridia bacterium]
MKCTVYCIGSLKEKYWKEAEGEYRKRLSRFGGWSVVELSESLLPDTPSQKQIDLALEKEGEALLKRINPRAYTIALCVEGKQKSSEELAALLAHLPSDGFSEIALLIGSSYGLSERVKQQAHLRLSFSKMTFPHQMMRVILAEQFFRAEKINAHESYHK